MIDAKQVADFLDSSLAIRRINFVLDWGVCRIEPNPGAYKKIADGFRTNKISVNELTPSVKLAISASFTDVLGGYNPSDNTFYFKEYTNIYAAQTQSTIIHECTHALVDGYRIGAVTMVSNEVAAFIAECVFRLHNNIATSDIPSDITDIILPIACRILNEHGKQYQIPKGDKLNELMKAMSLFYGIPAGATSDDSDGIPGVEISYDLQKQRKKDAARPRP